VLDALILLLGRIQSAMIELRNLRTTCHCLTAENHELRQKVDLLNSRLRNPEV